MLKNPYFLYKLETGGNIWSSPLDLHQTFVAEGLIPAGSVPYLAASAVMLRPQRGVCCDTPAFADRLKTLPLD